MVKPSATTINPPTAKITVLYDAFGKNPALQKDWGYTALIEYGGKRILFDTGDNPEILAHNTKEMKVDLSKLDFVVMSHRHSDHMGGLSYLLSVNPKVKIFAPKENFGVYGFSLPSTFYRKDTSLPPEQRYYDGNPPEIMKFGTAWPGANFELIEKTTKIAPGIHLIFQISDKPTTMELRELSLAIDTPEGIVLVVQVAGYDQDIINKLKSLLSKDNLKLNPETQLLEDVVDLTFLEYYFEAFVNKYSNQYDEKKLLDILRKIWKKLSEKSHEAALKLNYTPEILTVVKKALGF